MTDEKFEAQVRRLERYAKQSPSAYQAHVGLLAALGYGYIFAIVLLLLALIAVLIGAVVGLVILTARHASFGALNALKLLIPLGMGLVALIGVIFRSFQVDFPEPNGIPIERSQAPRLFAAVDEICRILQAPRFDHVLVQDEFNASVFQRPRFGLLGGHTNYLMVGLPLMEAVPAASFRAVLAHEIGHLSRSHSRFSGWIYRVRATWDQMLHSLIQQQHGGVSLFLPFFRWYSPYFAAYSFVLRRGNEYVADRCAAQVCGAETAAQMLVLSELKGRSYGQEFWRNLLKQARTQPSVPNDLYSSLRASLRQQSEQELQWYEDALEERTGLGDTHPSLTDRLAALGYRMVPGGPLDLPKLPLPLPPPVLETAADIYLGPLRDRIMPKFNAARRQEIAEVWVKQNQEARLQEQKLEDLEAKTVQGRLTLHEAWERALLFAQVHGDAEALPVIQEYLRAQPDHAEANFVFGKMLLGHKDARGIPYLKKAMGLAPASVGAGCEAIYWFLRGQNRAAEAVSYRERAVKHQREWEAGHAERETVSPTDKFLYHGLSQEELARFREQLARFEAVGQAYLVRKQVRYLADKPLYVLGIVPAGTRDPDLASWLGSKLQFPGETILIILAGNMQKMEKPLAQLATARILSR
jgi:Zn-dependent protease with chaperone function